jgi:predicted RNA binding protein YcfA (HicA-like mRNA interferase family)
MPKLPGLSGSELVEALERLGFERVRQRGSHLVMRRGSIGAVIPLHDELKTGTLRGILRQGQVSVDELQKGLRGGV